MLSVRCLVCPLCLSVTLVYCSQTVGRIKMKLGMRVGLSPGYTVRWGPTSPPLKGHSPPPILGPYLLQPNGCMDQDATRHGARPRPRRLSAHVYCVKTAGWIKMVLGVEFGLSPGDFVLDGDPASLSPIFDPFLLWPNGSMHQDATWYGDRPQPSGLYVR